MAGPDEKQPSRCAHAGSCGAVWFAQVGDGSFPAQEFWDDLTSKQQAKFLSLFATITNEPTLRLCNRQQFKQVDGDLFEFKRNDIQMRIFAFRAKNCWYLVSGLRGKKEDELPAGDVQRAKALMNEAKAVLGQ